MSNDEFRIERAQQQGAALGSAKSEGSKEAMNVARQTDVNEICESLDSLSTQAAGICHDIHNYADSFYGPVPEPETTAATPPVRAGAVGAIEHRIRELNNRLMYLREGVDRFNNLV